MEESILITGNAGFIGHHVLNALLLKGYNVIAIDSMDDYYSVELKKDRLKEQGFQIEFDVIPGVEYKNTKFPSSVFYRMDICNKENLQTLFKKHNIRNVVHLAAQPGVRYSLEHPQKYIDTNITGFLNILECSKEFEIKHLVYASSSSVYGLNDKMPLSESDPVDHPISMYGVTKRCNELMAHMYSHVYNLPTTGLRFFTVYGPWARPDMALFSFAKAIYNNQPITVFNHGNMVRDFTYVSDIVDAILQLIDRIPSGQLQNQDFQNSNPAVTNSNQLSSPYRILNIGSNSPVELMRYISLIEENLGKKAHIVFEEIQAGDLMKTHADLTEIEELISYRPQMNIEKGIQFFCDWFVNWSQNQKK